MFEPFPNHENGGGWYSGDAIMAEHVHSELAEAEAKREEAQLYYDELVRNSSEEELAHGWPDHASEAQREVAALARIRAVLMTALHIEGVVNAWGVYVAGEDFFKTHIERCRLESKIALTIALDGKGCIPKDHPVMPAISDLFERRNQIAHRKTKEWQGSGSPDHIRYFKSTSDLEACKTALNAFHELLLEVDQRAAFFAGVDRNNEMP